MFIPEDEKVLKEALRVLRRKQQRWDGETDTVLLHKTAEGLAELLDPTYVGLF